MNKAWICRIRGAGLFGMEARRLHRSLTPGQPLILTREPGNPADHNAIIISDVMGSPCGYVERKVAAELAPVMDAGFIPTARTHSSLAIIDRVVRLPRALIRVDGQTVEKEQEMEAA